MQKRILVAPLNWGLGHATRCIPIINALLEYGYIPIIGSDGGALALLRKEFPELEAVELPTYGITYAKRGHNFKLKMIWDSPKVLKAVKREKKVTKKLVRTLRLDAIISDNRLGVRYKKVPSIFITHQLNVLTGNTTWMTSKVHQRIIRKFTECWVPDVAEEPNLSGKLGHLHRAIGTIRYIGPLSRFEKMNLPEVYNLMVLLSGPEPQRTLLEKKIRVELKNYRGRVLMVRGVVEPLQRIHTEIGDKLTVTEYNFMRSGELQRALNESQLILCRSGYTTIMDLAKLEKKAFFVPTPGQYEQEYLAKRLMEMGIVPSCSQDMFDLSTLGGIQKYQGLKTLGATPDYEVMFSAFSKVNENSEPTSVTLST